MKNAQKIQLMFIVIVALIGALLFERVRKTVPESAPAPVFVFPRPKVPEQRTPEFRRAPVKQYRPGRSHQMGVLTDDAGTTLPLYGKTVRGHRDRFHYWTTTGVTNLFSVPITHNDRDCIDDIGCPEFYGNETVSVLGKTGSFTVNLYRTDDFF